jgi:CheY-like chemotaxis protein
VEPTRGKKVLVAANPGVRDLLTEALSPLQSALIFCDSVDEASSLLHKDRFDFILCTLQFDGSRWADLLRRVKAASNSCAIPFLIVKVSQGLLSEAVIESSLKAAKLIGANESANLPAWRREYGDEQACLKLRNLITGLW